MHPTRARKIVDIVMDASMLRFLELELRLTVQVTSRSSLQGLACMIGD
jgi:hypothetical protein